MSTVNLIKRECVALIHSGFSVCFFSRKKEKEPYGQMTSF